MAQMFVAGCQDASPTVAVAALSATTCFITNLEDKPELMHLQPVITPMLQVLHAAVERGDNEEVVLDGFDVIQTCCAMTQPLINDHVAVSPHCYSHFIAGCLTLLRNKE
jgi:hypothetical protein